MARHLSCLPMWRATMDARTGLEPACTVLTLESGGVQVPRPSGEGLFHVTVTAVNGIPPVHTNWVVERHGWTPVVPFPVSLIPVERKGG